MYQWTEVSDLLHTTASAVTDSSISQVLIHANDPLCSTFCEHNTGVVLFQLFGLILLRQRLVLLVVGTMLVPWNSLWLSYHLHWTSFPLHFPTRQNQRRAAKRCMPQNNVLVDFILRMLHTLQLSPVSERFTTASSICACFQYTAYVTRHTEAFA